MEAAARKGLGRGCTAKMNDRGELLLLLLVGGPVWSACKQRRNLAVQKHRCELDSVARHDASIKRIEPAAVLHDSVVADAISSCFGEGCVGHLVHADGARGGLIDRERIPSQAPPPIGSCYRIPRTLDLRQGGEQLGRDGGRGILAKERRILLPSLGRHLVHRAAHGKEHLGRLAYYLIDEVRRGKDGEDGRRNDDDPNRRRCRIQLVPCPAGALAPGSEPDKKERPVSTNKRQRKRHCPPFSEIGKFDPIGSEAHAILLKGQPDAAFPMARTCSRRSVGPGTNRSGSLARESRRCPLAGLGPFGKK